MKIFISMILALALSACALVGKPETPKQNLIVVEYAVQAASSQAINLIDAGVVPVTSADELIKAVDGVEVALAAARTGVDAGDTTSMEKLDLALSALIKLLGTYQQGADQ